MNEPIAKVHDTLSTRVLLPVLKLQQALRPNRRPVARAFKDAQRFRVASRNWSDDQKREWILNRLRRAVRHAYRHTAYYRQMLDGIGFDPETDFGFADFASLPTLEREAVHKAGKSLLANSVPSTRVRRDATGGSTGTPTEVWRGGEEEGWNESGHDYFNTQIGVPPGSRIAHLWGHHLDPVANDRLADRVLSFVLNTRWFDCFRLSPEILEKYHAEMQEYRPAAIIAYASALGNLAEHILERGHKPAYPTRCLVTGAEKLLPAHRKAIEQAFRRPVHERYGSRDVAVVGFQLHPRDSFDYTIDWANVLVEPETGQPNADILITKLHADAMPMIRYRIGDTGHFPDGSVPGHPTFSLRDVLGRTLDRIWLPNGRWIHGIQLPHLLKDHPVREFMFIQNSDYSVCLKIVPKQDFVESSRQSIEATIATNLPGLAVTTEIVNEIPKTKAGKWRTVLSNVNSAGRQAP